MLQSLIHLLSCVQGMGPLCALQELPALVTSALPVNAALQGIFGHSMGGHGALVCALKNPVRLVALRRLLVCASAVMLHFMCYHRASTAPCPRSRRL